MCSSLRIDELWNGCWLRVEEAENSSSLGGGFTKIKLESFWPDSDFIAIAEPVSNHATTTIATQQKVQRVQQHEQSAQPLQFHHHTTIPAWRCKTSKSTSKIALAPMTVGKMMVAKKSTPSGMVALMKPIKLTGNGNVILSSGSIIQTTSAGNNGNGSSGLSAGSTGSRKEEKIMFQHENDAKPWKCKSCGRNYKWKNSLKCHIKNECGVPPKYFCERMCGYKTHIHSNLKRHLNSKFCKPN